MPAGDPHPDRPLGTGELGAERTRRSGGRRPRDRPDVAAGEDVRVRVSPLGALRVQLPVPVVDGAVEAVGGRVIAARSSGASSADASSCGAPVNVSSGVAGTSRAGRRGRSRPAGSHRSPSGGAAPRPRRHRAASARLHDPGRGRARTGRRGTSRRRASTRLRTRPRPASSSATYPTPVASTCRCRIENTSREGAGASNPRGANTVSIASTNVEWSADRSPSVWGEAPRPRQ